ncbi:MAG: carboxypeptidase-like regulatory domain-containing protein [Acidobacteriia bacterium]|nr:carboxypeptidase-like regulatory domain-containing protein [Terriglobia bacterium]
MLKRNALLVAVIGSVLSLTSLLFGQANSSFSGTVADKTGSVISGATVKIISQETGVTREVKTDESGHYQAPFLAVSIYTIRVESQGFQITEQKDIRLQVAEQREINFTLNPASVSQTVEVSATQVAVETTNPTLGQVITEQQVSDLPLNGRNFVQLATLTPGVTQETNPNSFFNGGPSSEVSTRGSFSLSVGGSRASSTDWLYDGVDNNELTAGGIAVVPSVDAIQEFKVLTYNYSAEYGTRAGPTVLVTSKSGSNQFHGSLFEFFRNTSLDAKSYFAISKEKFNLNQFGGSLGGALQKDKTFFFVDYQAKRQRRGIPNSGLVPSVAMRGGDFTLDPSGTFPLDQIYNPYSTNVDGSPRQPFYCTSAGVAAPVNADGTQDATAFGACNVIPQDLMSPVTKQIFASTAFYPLPNVTGNPNVNYSSVPVRKLNEGEFDVRLDHNFSGKDSVFARFSYDQADSYVPGGSPGFAEANGFASNQLIANHGRNVAISETHIFNDRNINQFTAGFNRIFNHIKSQGDRSCAAAKLGIAGADINSFCGDSGGISQSTKDCVSCGMTSTLVGGGFWALGDRGFAPFQGGTNVFSIADSFDMIRGHHNIRIGGGFRANQMNVETNAFQDGFFVFTNLWTANTDFTGGYNMADFALGATSLAIHDQTFKGATTGRRWKLFRPYIQDDWRVTNNLTLNIGVAWALVTPITEAHNRQANFDMGSLTVLVPGVNSDGRVGIQFDKTAVEPRIGLAWKPFGSQTTAVRAGYAIFHDSSWNQGAQGLWENPPFFAESDFFGFTASGCPSYFTPSGGVSFCGQSFGQDNVNGLTMSQGFQIFTTPPDPAHFQGTFQGQNLDFKQGQVQQFNLNIERQMPGNVVVTAGYAGSRAHHILVDGMNLNVAQPTACGVVPGYTLGCGIVTPPAGPFTVVAGSISTGLAHYDSLQFKAETKSMRHGLYGLMGYTYARSFDSGFNDGLGSGAGVTYYPLTGTKHADWALSQINLNQQFTASVIYDLPFGKGKRFGGGWSGPANTAFGNWQITVIEKATTGFPIFTIASNNASGVNLTNNGNNYNRPVEISDPHKAGIVATNSDPKCQILVSAGGLAPDRVGGTGAWFNPCAFDNPPSGELGTANRSPLYGPGYVNTDFSAIKNFALRESMRLEFRAEMFNLFNHNQLGMPAADLNSTGFGAITSSVNNPRLVQFALKLEF